MLFGNLPLLGLWGLLFVPLSALKLAVCLSLPLPDCQCLQVRAHELHFSVSHARGSAWPIVGAQSMPSIRIVKGMIKTGDRSSAVVLCSWCFAFVVIVVLLLSCQTLQLHGLQPARLLCPSDFPGKNTGVGCHASSRWSSWPRGRICISCWTSKFFTPEPPGKPCALHTFSPIPKSTLQGRFM